MNRVNKMSKLVVLSELKKYIDVNDNMMKGTYVKTLQKELNKPINKTTELHNIKVGDKFMLVPIVKKEDVQEEAIGDNLLSKLLSKIKNPNDRDIVKQYVIQQNLQEVIDISNIKKAEVEKEADVDGGDIDDETKQFQELKTKYQKQFNKLTKLEDYEKLLTDAEFQQFQENLKDNKLDKLARLLGMTMNTVRRKLESKEAITKAKEAEKAETIEQKIAKIKEKEQSRRDILTKREQPNIDRKKLEAEAKVKAIEEKKAREEAEAKEKAKPKPKPKAEPKAKPKETEADKEEKILVALKQKEKEEQREEKKKKAEAQAKVKEAGKTETIKYMSGAKNVSVEVPKKGEKEPTTQKEANLLYGWTQSKFDKYKAYLEYEKTRQLLKK